MQSSRCPPVSPFFFGLGLLNIFRPLPFGLALGVSRRACYARTVLLAAALAAVYGLALSQLPGGPVPATPGWPSPPPRSAKTAMCTHTCKREVGDDRDPEGSAITVSDGTGGA